MSTTGVVVVTTNPIGYVTVNVKVLVKFTTQPAGAVAEYELAKAVSVIV